MDFYQRENTDGIRFTWNYWPNTKLTQTRVVVPPACLYTPLKNIENMPIVEYSPILCKQCRSIMNPHCNVDFRFKTWMCPFCHTKNSFPSHYADNISETSLPAELIQDYTTIEYIVPGKTAEENEKPIFLFVVDTAVSQDELVELKDSLQQSLNFIAEDALIGLITYGKMAYVHELGFTECPKAFVFRGDKQLQPK
jgi:protein transport protein SEC23